MEDKKSDLSLEVLGLFRLIFKSANKHFEAIEKSVGISGAQLWALSEIASSPDITVNRLAKVMSLHQSTTSNLIDKMEEKGLIERTRSEQDRRVVNVRPTEQGQSILNNAPGPFKGILPDALMRMDDKSLLDLKTNLMQLIATMQLKSRQAVSEPLGTPINLKQ